MYKLMLIFSTLALGVALAAATHHLTINDPSWVAGKELKPGEYEVELEGGNAVIKGEKGRIEVPAKTETSKEKYPQTEIRSRDINGKKQIEEIQFGGSHMSVVFPQSSARTGASN